MNNPLASFRDRVGNINAHYPRAVYFFIGCIVSLFNLIAVFGSKVLILDDQVWYTFVLEGRFPSFFNQYSLLNSYKEWYAWNIMAFSPTLARGLYVLLLMVPISCALYYLLHRKFRLSPGIAFAVAVLPNILPYQWTIPVIINFSYTLWGTLLVLISMILGLAYLEKSDPRNMYRWLGAVFFYFIALDLMEQSLFLFPPLALAFLGYTKLNKKHLRLIVSFLILALGKFIWMISVPRIAAASIPFSTMLERIGMYTQWGLPFFYDRPLLITLLFGILVLIALLLILRDNHALPITDKPDTFPGGTKKYLLYLYLFFIFWTISSAFVFVTINSQCQERHAQIPAIGLNALLILSIYIILNRGFAKRYHVHLYIFALLIFLSGFTRYTNLKAIYDFQNASQAMIVQNLKTFKFPPRSQIVIANIVGVPEGWAYCSGYLQFALKRKDLNGLLGPNNPWGYYNFDNHFIPEERGYGTLNSWKGLDIHRPTFFFMRNNQNAHFEQLEYALQWKGQQKDAPWTILKSKRKTGKLLPYISGSGWDQYLSTLSTLESQGIPQSKILWGGPPCPKELERMQLIPVVPLLHIDFGTNQANSFLRSGWSVNEGDASGDTFTWALGKTASLAIPIPKDKATVVQARIKAIQFNSPQIITLKVDGKTLGKWTLTSTSWNWQTFRLTLPPDKTRPAISLLEFLFSQQKKPDIQENRPLAVLFDSLEIIDSAPHK